jgi:hypothetical protein
VSTATIEQLQRIVSDENRSETERKQAAEHILRLQESNQEAAPPAESDEEQVRRIFANILGLDGAEERHRIEDQTMQVCASCFRLQPRTNTACELCSDAAGWLVPSQARKNAESDMFIRMACDYSVEQLRISLQSGWARTPERERVARLLLASREAKLHPQHEANIQTAPEDSPRSVLLEQLL